MLTGRVVNRLHSSSHNDPNERDMILLASNDTECSMFSFNSNSTVQPIMKETVQQLDVPSHINTLWPIFSSSENHHFLRGMSILPGALQQEFSIAMLNNDGNIFLQDYFVKNKIDKKQTFHEFKYENSRRKKDYTSLQFDEITKVRYFDKYFILSICFLVLHGNGPELHRCFESQQYSNWGEVL